MEKDDLISAIIAFEPRENYEELSSWSVEELQEFYLNLGGVL